MEKPSKLEIQKQSEDNMIKNIRSLFRLKKENNTIKDFNQKLEIRIIRNMRTLFELQEEDYFKLVRVVSLQNNGYVNMIEITVIEIKVTVIEINTCQLKNTLTKLNLT